MGEEVERRNSELEREVTGLRNSYWTERKARLAAEAQVEAMRKALGEIVEAARYKGSGLIDDVIAEGATVPHELIRKAVALSAPAEESSLQKMQSASRDHARSPSASLDLAAIRTVLLANVRWEIWKEVAYAFDLAASSTPESRPCTCHPDDAPPVPCAGKYALTECQQAEESSASPWRDIESAPWEPAPGEQWMLLWNGHWRGVGRRWAGYDGDPGFCDETTEFITPEPTHWLPLPAPPKAEAPAEARSEQAEGGA